MSKLPGTKKLSRKETRKIIFNKLSTALAEYKTELKEKKFDRNLKKFSKILASDLAKSSKQDALAVKTKKIRDVQTKVNELQPAK